MFSPNWSNIPIAWPESVFQNEIPSIPSHTCNTSRAVDRLKKQKHYQHLRSSYSPWACARTGSKGFTYTNFWGKKKISLWVWNLDWGCSLFQFEQKENYIIATYSCCVANSVFQSVLAAAGSHLYSCSPTLEVKAGAGLYPSSRYCSTQRLHFCSTVREKQMLPKLALPFAILKHPSSLTQNILTLAGNKKLVLFAKLRALQYSLVFNNLET